MCNKIRQMSALSIQTNPIGAQKNPLSAIWLKIPERILFREFPKITKTQWFIHNTFHSRSTSQNPSWMGRAQFSVSLKFQPSKLVAIHAPEIWRSNFSRAQLGSWPILKIDCFRRRFSENFDRHKQRMQTGRCAIRAWVSGE